MLKAHLARSVADNGRRIRCVWPMSTWHVDIGRTKRHDLSNDVSFLFVETQPIWLVSRGCQESAENSGRGLAPPLSSPSPPFAPSLSTSHYRIEAVLELFKYHKPKTRDNFFPYTSIHQLGLLLFYHFTLHTSLPSIPIVSNITTHNLYYCVFP